MGGLASLSQGALAEAIGTFALVFVGAGAIVVGATVFATGGFTHADLLAIAFAHGLTIFVMVAALGHISGGQFNPAVSLGLLVAKKIDGRTFGTFVLAQLVGATVGALGVYYLVAGGMHGWGAAGIDATTLGLPSVQRGSAVAAAGIEAVLTFFLALVVLGVIDARNQSRLGGLAIGMTVALDILVGGPITGAAMNPARWFGPALVEVEWTNAWVYVVGPLAGGALAGAVYGFVLGKEPSAAGR
ncbi:MAG TPA: aquaporin [Candidatus Thermoplasmatota archaeon]|nr:aquaporin [Candidatus Thermoplasmatota archaeon]